MTGQRVYVTILNLTAENGVPPTERQVAAVTGLARSTVHEHMRRLLSEGKLVEVPTGGRYAPASASPELAVNTCLFCGASLAGMRRDARYCSDSHRVMAARERKAA